MLKKFILKMFDNSTKFVARILLVIAAIFCLLFGLPRRVAPGSFFV